MNCRTPVRLGRHSPLLRMTRLPRCASFWQLGDISIYGRTELRLQGCWSNSTHPTDIHFQPIALALSYGPRLKRSSPAKPASVLPPRRWADGSLLPGVECWTDTTSTWCRILQAGVPRDGVLLVPRLPKSDRTDSPDTVPIPFARDLLAASVGLYLLGGRFRVRTISSLSANSYCRPLRSPYHLIRERKKSDENRRIA